ncbi:MAG: HEAT repeat domain-containing protein [Planctomycetota bacterium]|nr:HEAT repeat domain-containing protein [Planctomycetota bacterium]
MKRIAILILSLVLIVSASPKTWAGGADIRHVSNKLRFAKTVKDKLIAIRDLEELAAKPGNRDICVLEFTTALKDPDPKVRLSATIALGRMGHAAQGSRPELVQLLQDPDEKVRAAADSALGRVISVENLPKNSLIAFLVLYLPALIGSILIFMMSEKRKIILNTVLGISFLCLVAKLVFVIVPTLAFYFDGSDAFIYLERDFAIPFGILFFAIASKLVPEDSNRRALRLMTILLLIIMPGQNYWVFTTPPSYSHSDGVWIDGVCMQSTNFTCGAASAATVLRAHGVPDAVEHECAYYSHTLPFRGVTDVGAARALRKHLPDKSIRIRETSIAELKDLTIP